MKYLRYINENSNIKFRIGDTVKLVGCNSGLVHDGKIGTIIDIRYQGNLYDVNGEGPYEGIIYLIEEINYWISPKNIMPINLKKIERPDIDPYNEDDWGYVQED